MASGAGGREYAAVGEERDDSRGPRVREREEEEAGWAGWAAELGRRRAGKRKKRPR